MELPSKYQIGQSVQHNGIPKRSNPVTIFGVSFWSGGVTTYSVQLNNDPGGQRHGVAEEELTPVDPANLHG